MTSNSNVCDTELLIHSKKYGLTSSKDAVKMRKSPLRWTWQQESKPASDTYIYYAACVSVSNFAPLTRWLLIPWQKVMTVSKCVTSIWCQNVAIMWL